MAYIVCTSNLDLVSFLFVPALYSTLKLEIFPFIIIILILNLVEEAKLKNYSIHIAHILQGVRVSCDAVHWGIIFTLTPLVLVLPMFFTTLHTLSQQP